MQTWGWWTEEDEQTHREVFAVEFEVLPHGDKQVQVQMIQQQVNRHVPLPAGLQQIKEQLHVSEAVHHYGQGLHTHTHTHEHTHTRQNVFGLPADLSTNEKQY